MNEIVKLWKELKIGYSVLTFDCGGDSMGEMDWAYYNKKGTQITDEKVKELDNFFDNEVFNQVEFYVNSDGHYMGEQGTVTITLNKDDEFEYVKEAMSEFSETYRDSVDVEVTEEEKVFLEEKVSNLAGGNAGWNDEKIINYKKDCILTEKEEELLNDLFEKLEKRAENHEFDNPNEQQEDYRWEISEAEINCDNTITMVVTREFYEYRQSD